MTRSYYRIFLFLKQARTEYSKGGRTAMGRCIIEARLRDGKVSVNVQDLKSEVNYKLYIMAAEDNKTLAVPIGLVYVDQRGRGEVRFNINPDDVSGTGKPIEDFNVAAIVVSGSQENNMITPLVGYKDDVQLAWKTNLEIYNNKHDEPEKKPTQEQELKKEEVKKDNTEKTQEEEPVVAEEIEKPEELEEEPVVAEEIEEPEELEEEPVIAEEIEESEEPEEELVIAEKIEKDDVKEVLEYIQIEHKEEPVSKNKNSFDNELDKNAIPDDDDIHEVFKAMVRKFNQEIEELSKYTFFNEDNSLSDNAQSNDGENNTNQPISELDIESIFVTGARAYPFEKRDNNILWVRTSPDELAVLQLDFARYMQHPFIVSSYAKYKHLIVGKISLEKETKYILGVPDIFKTEERPYAVELGFEQFRSCRGDISEGSHGYWLSVIKEKLHE